MQKPPQQAHDHAHALTNEDHLQISLQFKGIRLREWGKWVSEIRVPKSRENMYLGSYETAEQAARAFDAAIYCLRGSKAKFNFPNSAPAIPSGSSLTHQQIQVAAAKYALNEPPSTSPSLRDNIDNNSKHEFSQTSLVSEMAELSSDGEQMSEEPSRSSSVSEMELSSDGQQMSEKLAFWKSLFEGFHGTEYGLNLEKIPSIDEALALELIPTSQEEEVDLSVDSTALWNFKDV